jgi:Spy/CpxP family protein refolding chaperone
MNSRLLASLLMAGMAAAAMSPASAQHMSPGFPPPPPGLDIPHGEPLPPFLRGLVLSEEQQDRIFDLQQAARAAQRGRVKALMRARDELRQLSLSMEFDEARARRLAEAMAAAQAELELQRARIDQQLVKLLTPEQRSQLLRRPPPEARDGLPPPPR